MKYMVQYLWNTWFKVAQWLSWSFIWHELSLNQKYQYSNFTSFLLVMADFCLLQFHIARIIIQWATRTAQQCNMTLPTLPSLVQMIILFSYMATKNIIVIFPCIWSRELNLQCGVRISKHLVISQAKTIQSNPFSHNNWGHDLSIK